MKRLGMIGLLAMVLAAVTAAGPAAAAYIDFRAYNPGGNVVNSAYTLTLADISVTFSTLSSQQLWWDSTDGWGVYGAPGYEGDEVEQPEVLAVIFSRPVFVDYFDLTDLFLENGYAEIGWYNFTGTFNPADPTTYAAFQQVQTTSNGQYTLAINQAVSTIWFSAPGQLIPNQNHEFSIAGVAYRAVPVPPALMLLGSGLIGLAGIRRRKRA